MIATSRRYSRCSWRNTKKHQERRTCVNTNCVPVSFAKTDDAAARQEASLLASRVPVQLDGASPWRGAKLGLTGLKSRPPKERFCCAHAGGGAYLSPLVKGGLGGVGRRTSASSVCSPFARNDVRKRHALQAGEAAHTPSTSSIDRAKHASLVHSTLTGPPPLTPPSQGGERRRCARGICATNSEGRQEWCNPNFAPPQPRPPRIVQRHLAPRRIEAPCRSDARPGSQLGDGPLPDGPFPGRPHCGLPVAQPLSDLLGSHK